MNTAGAHELGYASAAIVAALLDTLMRNRIISRADASLERRCYCPERAWQPCQRGGSYSNHQRCQLATCETSHWLDRGFPFVTSP